MTAYIWKRIAMTLIVMTMTEAIVVLSVGLIYGFGTIHKLHAMPGYNLQDTASFFVGWVSSRIWNERGDVNDAH